MNRTARILLIVGLTAIGLSGLFPPWAYTYQRANANMESTSPAGRSLLFFPPSSSRGGYQGRRIDYGRLGLEWVVIGVLTGVGCLAFGRSESS